MNRALWLRLASGVSLLFAIGHTLGFSSTTGGGVAQATAVAAVQGAVFDLAGTSRNYWALFMGLGLVLGVFLVLQAVTLWLLANHERRRPGEGTAMIVAWLVANAAMLVLDLRYLFVIPQVMQAAVVVLLGLALVPWRVSRMATAWITGSGAGGERGTL